MTGRASAQHPAGMPWRATRRPAEGFLYADFPTRAAAFVIDLLIAGSVVLAVSVVVGMAYYAWTPAVEFEALVAIEMLVVAVACTLPTATAAWLWHTQRATPGQRFLKLKVAHWRSGERLSMRASLARWVLLYAPLVLLVAYPALAEAGTSRWPGSLLALYEVPWLPPATMTLPLLWYAALAYPALADRRRVRALHDRLSGSIVVREEPVVPAAPRPVDEDVPSLLEQPPFVWFARLGLPLTFYLLVLGAMVVAASDVRPLLTGRWELLEAVPWVMYGLASVLTVLTPAALLVRVREAVRTHTLLVLGLALAAVPLVTGALSSLAGGIGLGTPLDLLGPMTRGIALLGPLLIGLGLLQLRAGRASRPWLLLAIVGLLMAMHVLPLVVLEGTLISTYDFSMVLISAAVGGFALWVPVSALLDGERPRPFWALLALALPVQLMSLAFALAVMLTLSDGPQMQPMSSFMGVLTTLAMPTLAIIAYGRYTPRQADR